MIRTLNEVEQEMGLQHMMRTRDELPPHQVEMWLEVWSRMLTQFNEWNDEDRPKTIRDMFPPGFSR